MGELGGNEQLTQQLNDLEAGKDENFKKVTQEIKDLVDTNDSNDKIELSGKLTSNVADILKNDSELAKNLLTIMGSISKNTPDLNNDSSRTELQNFIKPYTQSFDFAPEEDMEKGGDFVKDIDKGENNSVNSARNKISELMNQLSADGNVVDGDLYSTLTSISFILYNPNKANTGNLQEFLYSRLTGKEQENFKKNNYKNGKPDGLFGPHTIEGLNNFLDSVTNYINDLNKSREIQDAHDKEKATIDEQKEIDNLSFSKVIDNAPFAKDNQDIKNIIDEIVAIEKRNDSLSKDQEENLRSELEKTKEEQKKFIDWITNPNKYKKEDIKGLKENGKSNDVIKQRIDNTYSKENVDKTEGLINRLGKSIISLEDQLDFNKNIKILNKMSQLEGHYKKLISDWNEEISKLNSQKLSNNEGTSPFFRQEQEPTEQQINQDIKTITGKINSVLEFFGWKEDEGRIVIDTKAKPNNGYRRYKSNLEKSETVDLTGKIARININQDFRLRGEWKNLNTEQIAAQKKDIEGKLNAYIGIQQYLSDEIKTVLALAQKALSNKTNLEDKNDGVWALERKLDELGYMGDGKTANNGVDGKFGHETYKILMNYIDASLKENAEINPDDIKVTLRGERSKDKWNTNPDQECYSNYNEFVIATKGEISDQINDYVKNWDKLSFNKKKILTLTKAALNAVSDDEAQSDEVKALETELGMPNSPSREDIHDSIDGRFGPITYEALKTYLETPDN